MRYQYDCVNPEDLEELEYIIDNSEEVTIKEFKGKVHKEDFEMIQAELGYNDEMCIEKDPYVRYHKSTTPEGKKVYYLDHSAIEYVFY